MGHDVLSPGTRQCFFLLFFVTYVIISPEPQCDGGQVKRISHEVSHVPHITDISLGTRVPKLLNLTPYQTCTETCQKNTNILHIHNRLFCAHAPRPLSRNFLQRAETLQKNLGHCHIEWHSNRVSRIGGKGGVLDLALCSMFFVRLSVMSGPGDVIHMAAVSGCLTPRLDRYYPTTIVLENNQALALLSTFCIPIP